MDATAGSRGPTKEGQDVAQNHPQKFAAPRSRLMPYLESVQAEKPSVKVS